ncbi:MAG: sugar ABC transporter permease [Spirochaetales bacterium]|jgi:putative aldouronate transport system permease protein|nr:sugar ABC transporter permease [Spirochaetales bacterium]
MADAVVQITNPDRQSFISGRLKREKRRKARKYLLLYVFFLVPAALLFIFHYIPIYGITIAFKDYRILYGIMGSKWNGFAHFTRLITDPYFGRIFWNTIVISFYRIAFGFPAPVILALLINEISNMPFKRIIQSISYLPHFMSWVVLAGIIIEVLSPQRGIIGTIYKAFGAEPPNLLTSIKFFRPMLILTGIWQAAGWGTIIYLAAISSIDPGQYESAAIDGASRFQRARYITIPALYPVMTILFLLRLGHVLNAGFDQIFNLYNPIVYEVSDIIDTFVYRVGLLDRQFDFSTAVGLFKNAIGVALILGTNAVVKRFSEYGIW